MNKNMQDHELAASHLRDAGGHLITRIADAIHEVVDLGLLEANGIRDQYQQEVCNCMFMALRNTVQNIVMTLVDHPVPSAITYPATTHLHLQNAAHFVLIQLQDVLHQLARSSILREAGLHEAQVQTFCQALFDGIRVTLLTTAKLYECC